MKVVVFITNKQGDLTIVNLVSASTEDVAGQVERYVRDTYGDEVIYAYEAEED
ncbi:hypothetical protein GH839_27860 [Bacillus thuringiensis]|nr:hypothetical protein [Bacillus thuringiensis]MRB24638.1 hypothetical protein [Bacillus thuringiensis]MRB43134.1 hypothetical protein [Bacillus thuringiensis]MRB49327.1 hypothetical protein [Bacillus thuringiensis]MRB55635.1 hypothetical protein [Bacillus thuringiensis]